MPSLRISSYVCGGSSRFEGEIIEEVEDSFFLKGESLVSRYSTITVGIDVMQQVSEG